MGLEYPSYFDEIGGFKADRPPAFELHRHVEGLHILKQEKEEQQPLTEEYLDGQIEYQFLSQIIPRYLNQHLHHYHHNHDNHDNHPFHSECHGSHPKCSFCNSLLAAPTAPDLQFIAINRILVENLFCIGCNSYIGFKIIDFIPEKPTLIPFESNGELLQFQNNLIHIENELKIRREEMELMRLVEKYGGLVGRIFYWQPGNCHMPQHTTILSQE